MPPLAARLRRPLSAVFLLAALCASGAARADAATAVVTGPAGPLTRAEVEAMVNDLVPPAQRNFFWANPDAIANFARSLYAQRLLAAEAQATGADATPEGQAYLKLLRERALTELLLRQRERAVLPTDQALDAYARTEYKARPDRFRQPDQVQARHILLAVAPDVLTPVGAGRATGSGGVVPPVPLETRSTMALMAAICGPDFLE